jgi:hypothetical protein
VNFTNVSINGQPLGATGNLTSIAMGDSTATLASPSAITDNNAFTVTEDTATSAGATPQPSAPTATIPTPDPTSPTTTTAPTHGHHHHHNGSASSTYGTPWGS